MDVLGNKKTEEDLDILVCAKTAAASKPVYGSIRANCFQCSSAVWVSISGQKALQKNNELNISCMECSFERMKDNKNIKAEIVPGAIEELKRYLLKIEEN